MVAVESHQFQAPERVANSIANCWQKVDCGGIGHRAPKKSIEKSDNDKRPSFEEVDQRTCGGKMGGTKVG